MKLSTSKKSVPTVVFLIAILGSVAANAAAPLVIGTTTESFDNLGTALPSGWTVLTGATASSLGTSESFSTSQESWAGSGGVFKNVASSAGQTSDASTATQNSSSNRALGIRQIDSFGDPGASFNYLFGTAGRSVTGISIDLQMLRVNSRSTIWDLQYGVGVAPTSFTTLGTYNDSGVFGSTTQTFNMANSSWKCTG